MDLTQALNARFADAQDLAGPEPDAATSGGTDPSKGSAPQMAPELTRHAARGSCRAFDGRPVPGAVLRTLAAVALAAPSKSDMQQRDIVVIEDPDQLTQVKTLLAGQDWIADAPSLVVICGNNRRQRLLHRWWDRLFANDHLDAFFNASVDAGIALMAYIAASEAAGLGCCPISTIRNRAQDVSDLLELPEHVFPVAGLAVGYPVYPSPRITPRLPLSVTVHTDRYSEAGLRAAVAAYDAGRSGPKTQRSEDRFGTAERYTWSDDKTRQYALPERADFGAFVRARGFRLD